MSFGQYTRRTTCATGSWCSRPTAGASPTTSSWADADPGIAEVSNVETFTGRVENIQKGLNQLNERFSQVNPDIVVMFGDDQSEFFFDDNMPSINVYWGDSIKVLPRTVTPDMSAARRMSSEAYGTREYDHPVPSDLGLYVIESLMEQEFDVSHSRYVKESYGGTIGPATWYLDHARTTQPRPFGLPHAYGFAVARWFDGKTPPILPISINTCYPPNWISPKRAYALGQAVRKAIEEWDHRQDRGLCLHRRPQPLRRRRGAGPHRHQGHGAG